MVVGSLQWEIVIYFCFYSLTYENKSWLHYSNGNSRKANPKWVKQKRTSQKYFAWKKFVAYMMKHCNRYAKDWVKHRPKGRGSSLNILVQRNQISKALRY